MAYGLRLMNNNRTADGNGRDFNIFGDKGFGEGKVLHSSHTRGSNPREVLVARHLNKSEKAIDASLSQNNLSSELGDAVKCAKSKGVKPTVVKKWHRAHRQSYANEAQAHRAQDATHLQQPSAPDPNWTICTKSPSALHEMKTERDELFALRLPTFPVPKYKNFPERHMREFADHPEKKDVNFTSTSPWDVKPASSHGRSATSHYWFGEPMITQSPHSYHTHPAESLSASRKTLGLRHTSSPLL